MGRVSPQGRPRPWPCNSLCRMPAWRQLAAALLWCSMPGLPARPHAAPQTWYWLTMAVLPGCRCWLVRCRCARGSVTARLISSATSVPSILPVLRPVCDSRGVLLELFPHAFLLEAGRRRLFLAQPRPQCFRQMIKRLLHYNLSDGCCCVAYDTPKTDTPETAQQKPLHIHWYRNPQSRACSGTLVVWQGSLSQQVCRF